jgi:cell wall-associated NlpC family hydrolase
MSLMDTLLNEPGAAQKMAGVMSMTGGASGPQAPVGRTMPATGMGRGAVGAARSQLGVDYNFGSADPLSAWDCSGLTAFAAQRVGVQLPHSAAEQSKMLPRVGADQLKKGDLVFYDYGRLGGDADHVGIYTGNGHMIAASSSADQVARQPVDWDHFMWGGRL